MEVDIRTLSIKTLIELASNSNNDAGIRLEASKTLLAHALNSGEKVIEIEEESEEPDRVETYLKEQAEKELRPEV